MELNDAIRASISKAVREGIEEGITRYAWWKDGQQFVGTGTYSLAVALRAAQDDPTIPHIPQTTP